MALLIMGLFTVAYLAIGPGLSFKSGSWAPSTLWIALSIVVGLGSAFVGGLTAQSIDHSGRAVSALVGVVLVVGLVLAFMEGVSVPGERLNVSPSNMEAMNNAVSPVWLNYLNPVLGAVGVFLSTKVKRSR